MDNINALFSQVTSRVRKLVDEATASPGVYDDIIVNIRDEAASILNTPNPSTDMILQYKALQWMMPEETLATIKEGKSASSVIICRHCNKGTINKKRGESKCPVCGHENGQDTQKKGEASSSAIPTADRWDKEAKTHLRELFGLETLPQRVSVAIPEIKAKATALGLTAKNRGQIKTWRDILKDMHLEAYYNHLPKIISDVLGVFPPELDPVDEQEIITIHARMRNEFTIAGPSEMGKKNLPSMTMFEYIIKQKKELYDKYKGVLWYFKPMSAETRVKTDDMIYKLWLRANAGLSK